MLLLVIGLGGVQRHGGHGADRPADLIVPQSEGRVIELGAPAGERLEGLPLQAEQRAGGIVDGVHVLRPALADESQFTAGHYHALAVHHADGAVGVLLHLQDDALKNSPRHRLSPSTKSQGTLCAICLCCHYIGLSAGMQEIFSFFHKKQGGFLWNI